jgi:signal transduction histidine kinase
MTEASVRSVRTRLFILLLRAFSAAVMFIVLVMLAAVAYFLAYPSSYNPIDRIPIITRLETYYLVKHSWQGVEVLPQTDLFNSDYHRFWQRTLILDEQGKVVLDHGSADTGKVGITYSQNGSESTIPIAINGKVIATLVLDESFFPMQRQLSIDFLWPIGVISFFMAIPTVIMGLFLMRRFVTPLAEVIAAARTVASGDLSTRVQASGPDDLRALSDSFNHMAASLEQSDNERRNMLADIAHELRTPLTVMRGRLEGIVDGIYPASAEQIGPALEETYLLERLVEDLRLLTLAETRQLHIEHRDVDLGDIAAHVLDLFQAEAEDKKIELSLRRPTEDVIASIDPQRIEQVVGNLVSNALRYTPECGHICITVEKAGEHAILTVSDDGPGVAAEDLPSIFNRFWRGEKSRSRASGGAGLGLAIAHQLVEAQGGEIRAENRPKGGLKMSVQFPIK